MAWLCGFLQCCFSTQDSAGPSVQYHALKPSGGQRRRESNSSQEEVYRKLGDVGPYEDVTRRPLKVKGDMEADHIPPMDSLKRAEKEPNFNALKNRSKVLYDMVMMSLKTTNGRNKLLAITVHVHHHRGALSTGSSKESKAVRGVVARSIARGDVMLMLKQAMIIAHPYCAQKMRENAGIATTTETQIDETNDFYRTAFLKMINYYCEKKLINETEKSDLEKYVNKDGYLKENSPEYQQILKVVRRSQR